MKFQLADEIVTGYREAQARPRDKEHDRETGNILDEISSMNGRCQDLRDGYSALREEYSTVWRNENRPYWLNNVTVRYDLAAQLWQSRGNQFLMAIGEFNDNRPLPALSSFGLSEGGK